MPSEKLLNSYYLILPEETKEETVEVESEEDEE